jgi:signal transduction histidine kinase
VATGTGLFLYLALAWVVWRASINEAAAIGELEERNRELERTNDALHEAQARLVEKERLAAVGQLAVGLHHAILNPLAGLLGALRLLEQGGLTASATAQTFEDAEAEIRKIEGLVRRLPGLRRTTSTPYVGGTTMLDLDPSAIEEGPDAAERSTNTR